MHLITLQLYLRVIGWLSHNITSSMAILVLLLLLIYIYIYTLTSLVLPCQASSGEARGQALQDTQVHI